MQGSLINLVKRIEFHSFGGYDGEQYLDFDLVYDINDVLKGRQNVQRFEDIHEMDMGGKY